MSPLPRGWSQTTIGQIAGNGQYGWTTRAAAVGKVKFLRTTDITNGPIDWNSVPWCQEAPASEKYSLQPGDVLVSRAGSVGFSVLLNELPQDAVFASYLIRFVPDQAVVVPEYLRHFLRSPNYWGQVTDASAGIALANVNATKLAAMELPLPPLAEQRRIAKELDLLLARVDASRDHLNRLPQILDNLRKSVLGAATSGELTRDWRDRRGIESGTQTFEAADAESIRDYAFPSSWTAQRLSDISSISGGLTKDSKKQSSSYKEVPYLRVANVQRGYLNLDEVKTIRVPPDRLEELLLRSGDILFNEGGDIDKLGRGWVWKGEVPRCVFQNHVFRARLFDPRFEPRYFSWYSNSRGYDYFLARGKQTTNLASINKSVLSALPVAVPPPEEQTEIVRRVESLLALADRIERRRHVASEAVGALVPSILSKAFRGELLPQDPER